MPKCIDCGTYWDSVSFNKSGLCFECEENYQPLHPEPATTKKKDNSLGFNVGKSNYSSMKLQPWEIFEAHQQLNYWEADIIKRLLRDKKGDSRLLDYEKIVHIAQHLVTLEKQGRLKR